jgi:outer membrane protein
MKKVSLYLNVVLFLAVAILYYLHFSAIGKLKSLNSGTSAVTETSKTGSDKVVFVNMDTLLNNYDYYKQLKSHLDFKQKKSQTELMLKQRNLEKAVADYQEKMQKGILSNIKAKELNQQLSAQQQSLVQLHDKLSTELAQEEQDLNRKLTDNIQDYLKEFNKDSKYQFIFSYSYGNNLLFADKKMDITQAVLKGLNKNHKGK